MTNACPQRWQDPDQDNLEGASEEAACTPRGLAHFALLPSAQRGIRRGHCTGIAPI
jgi:hypothetical protein